MKVDVEVTTEPSRTPRAQQLSAAFDVPLKDRETIRWSGDMPLDAQPWNVGLIVGPSGSGKTTIAQDVWGEQEPMSWSGLSTVDDFPGDLSIEDVTAACQAVGFNTIPAWLRPFDVLSNGEQFRASMARLMAEVDVGARSGPLIVDEFTSVVDRQVAQIGAHAVQKWARKRDQQFVAVTCHYDVIDWLQPDWVYRPDSNEFARRHLQRRPPVDLEVRGVSREAWSVFGPHHYLSGELHVAAKCVGAFVGDECVGFLAHYRFPHPRAKNIRVIHRLVVLPDYQGLGIGRALSEQVGQLLAADGDRLRITTAHPAVIHGLRASPRWEESKTANAPSRSKKPKRLVKQHASARKLATRAFEYVPVG